MSTLHRKFLAALVVAFSTDVTARAIILGDPPTPGSPEGRSTVVLIMPSGTICSGTIVGPRIILTAAHCVSGDPATPVFAKVGERVRKMTCAHDPRYPSTVGADLALCASGDDPFANQSIARS